MAAGRSGSEVLVWAAAPGGLLGLADAAYVVQARRLVALAGKDGLRVEEVLRLQAGGGGFWEAVGCLRGLGSFSVWPFYGVLGAMVVVLGQSVLVPVNGKGAVVPQWQGPGVPGSAVPYAVGGAPGGMLVPSGVPQGGNGGPSFQPPVSPGLAGRPNMPPMGVAPKPGTGVGPGVKPVGVPRGAAPAGAAGAVPGFNRPGAKVPTGAVQPGKVVVPGPGGGEMPR